MSTHDITSFDSEDAELRANIRRLVDMFGDTVSNLLNEEIYDLIEYVRVSTRTLRESPNPEMRGELIKKLDESSLWMVIRTVGAFTSYFHIANVAEQHPRIEFKGAAGARREWLEEVFARVREAKISKEEIGNVIDRLEVRTLYTAHPTEAARLSILSKLRRVGEMLNERSNPRLWESEIRRINRRLSEVIEEILQTDELRPTRPEPASEARNIMYYMEDVLAEMNREWALFNTLISNVEMTLVKSSMEIAGRYVDTLVDPSLIHIFEDIKEERNKTINELLRITEQENLLDHQLVLKRTLAVREYYVDPLNYLQVSLLLSINGVAAGLKNTG